ncbi:MAG: tyrosine-protein phosphatase [Myxococcota bacterium]
MQRKIPLEGCFNFRDLGGYPTRDGRRVRWRRLFRSDGLQLLTDADVAHLRDDLRLASIVDLRSTAELEQDGRGRLAGTDMRFHHVPFFDGPRSAQRPPPEQTLADLYLGMIERAGAPIARAISVLAETPPDRAAVYHCAAGKDRTGVLSALLLSLLGVDDELIVADYALSQESMDDVIARLESLRGYEDIWKELPPDTMHAHPDTMRRLLTALDERWGGAAGLAKSIGVAPRALDALREHGLE